MTMIIAFETMRLRAICEDGDVADKVLGAEAAEALRQRLADLRAADTISDLIVGSPRTGGADGSVLTITLTPTVRTIWAPNHTTALRSGDGQIDWTRTTRVRLLEIVGA